MIEIGCFLNPELLGLVFIKLLWVVVFAYWTLFIVVFEQWWRPVLEE